MSSSRVLHSLARQLNPTTPRVTSTGTFMDAERAHILAAFEGAQWLIGGEKPPPRGLGCREPVCFTRCRSSESLDHPGVSTRRKRPPQKDTRSRRLACPAQRNAAAPEPQIPSNQAFASCCLSSAGSPLPFLCRPRGHEGCNTRAAVSGMMDTVSTCRLTCKLLDTLTARFEGKWRQSHSAGGMHLRVCPGGFVIGMRFRAAPKRATNPPRRCFQNSELQ